MGQPSRIDIQHRLPNGKTYVTTTLDQSAAEQIFESLVSKFPDHAVSIVAGRRILRRHPSYLKR